MISLDDARATVRDAVAALSSCRVPAPSSIGHVLAAPAYAAFDVPPFSSSAMDGYALSSRATASVPVTLQVVARVLAGDASPVVVGDGEAVRIMTGAPLPAGADSVCMVERTVASTPGGVAGEVRIDVALTPGENVRPAGSDVRRGDEVLGAGAYVGGPQLASLLSAGCRDLQVVPRPRVGVISTGDELVDPGSPLGPAQIYDTNRPMLVALAAEAGSDVTDLGRAPDDVDELARRIEAALGSLDALVLSGGVSVGDADVVRMALDRLGGERTHWMQIAIRPAKPFSFTALASGTRRVPVFGLPGNPVSAGVSFELLVRPALRVLGGHRDVERPRVVARAGGALQRRRDGKIHFVRVQLASDGRPGTWRALPCPGQGSHQLRSLGLADGLCVLPDGDGAGEGDEVEVIVTNPACVVGCA